MSAAVASRPVYIDVQCPSCGVWRSITTRSARREARRCRGCLNPPTVPPVTDEYRLFWLRRFDDDELALIGWALGGHGSVGAVAAARARLSVVAAA